MGLYTWAQYTPTGTIEREDTRRCRLGHRARGRAGGGGVPGAPAAAARQLSPRSWGATRGAERGGGVVAFNAELGGGVWMLGCARERRPHGALSAAGKEDWRRDRHGQRKTIGRYPEVRWQKNCYLAETIRNSQFLCAYTPSHLPFTWQAGLAWEVRRARYWWKKFSIVFDLYSIDSGTRVSNPNYPK